MPRHKPKTRHGATQPETARGAEQVKLRLHPTQRADLDALATAWGRTLSETVAEAVREMRSRCRGFRCGGEVTAIGYCAQCNAAQNDTSGT